MLVLSRKPGDVVYIGDSIAIKVLGVDRGKVRLGFEAPDGVKILRAELAAGTPLHMMEDRLDYEENQRHYEQNQRHGHAGSP